MPIVLPLLLLAGLYLFVLPRRRQMAARRAAGTSVEPGDSVLIGGCIHGTVVSVDDDVARIEVAPGVVLEVLPRTFRKAERPVAAAHDFDGHIGPDVVSGPDVSGPDVLSGPQVVTGPEVGGPDAPDDETLAPGHEES